METTKRLRLWQGVVFGVLWLAYGSTYLLRKPIGVLKADLQKTFDINALNLGWLDAALLLPYAGVSIMLGSVGDRLGPRVTLGGGLIISSVATASISMCESFAGLLMLLALSGASQALCWPACCALLGRWFSDAARNTVFGVFGTCCFVFGMAGTTLAVYLQGHYGWRVVFLPPSILVAVLGMLVLQVGKDPGERSLIIPGRATAPAGTGGEVSLSILAVWKLSPVPEVSVAMFCVKSVRYALMFWLPLYLFRSHNYSQATAGMISTAFEVGGILGSVCVGLVVDRWMGGRAIYTSALAISASALSLLAFVMLSSWGTLFLVTFLVLAGVFNCGPDVLLAGSVAADIGERVGGASAVIGVVNGMGSLGTVLEGPLVGLVTSYLGWGSMIPLMVILSALGALAAFKANIMHARSQGWLPVSSNDVP
ncbi:putative glycerol-3-phosphate transporter 3 [Chionoecetes opilio]|uniref:Putative glycerol-3-phosphate transporter 3 n=1 Tax=Chionoecetes opilio TaxID=41210 RepID=A0A8J4XYE7_CHIOP|nr:putative glycerol-3-phosphate transporter 3 [Chionoecetes opilio]